MLLIHIKKSYVVNFVNANCRYNNFLLKNFVQAPTRASLSLEVDPTLRIDRRRSESLERTPQTAPECVQNIVAEPQTSTKHRRHLSACGTIQRGVATANMDSR